MSGGFREGSAPRPVRQAESQTSRWTLLELKILGDLSCSMPPLLFLFLQPLYFVTATYEKDSRTWDIENATSGKVSAIHPSLFKEMHPVGNRAGREAALPTG